METISVIIPVYNIENYVRACIESVCAQTYKDLEIILVDDGSSDNSGAICDEYAKKDARIRVIHKQNGGLSAARNDGIEAAKGKYLAFVDGDDYVEPEMYERLYKALMENDAEMSICSFRYVGGMEERNDKIEIRDEVLTGQEILLKKRMSPRAWGWVYAWNKLYKRELFETLRYPVGMAHEDDYVAQDLFWDIKRVVSISYRGYNYVQRATSITNTYRANRLDEVDSKLNRAAFYEQKGVDAQIQYKNLMRGYHVFYDIYAMGIKIRTF